MSLDYRLYSAFASETRQHLRFMRSSKGEELLNLVRKTMGKRLEPLPKNARLFRAQIGCEYDDREVTDHDGTVHTVEEPLAYGRDRMYPTPEHAGAGRISPKGIPCLYLSFELETAIYEMRPWINAMVSLGIFATKRELNIVNCTHGSSLTEFDWLLEATEVGSSETSEPTPEQLEEIVWGEINLALSMPVRKDDDPISYIPTEILSELFKVNGADGIAYKSAVKSGGHNVALFNSPIVA